MRYPEPDDRNDYSDFTIAVATKLAEMAGMDLATLRNFGEEPTSGPLSGNNKDDFLREAESVTYALENFRRLNPVELAEIWAQVGNTMSDQFARFSLLLIDDENEILEVRYFEINKSIVSQWSYDAVNDDWSNDYTAMLLAAMEKYGDHDDTGVVHDNDWKLVDLHIEVNETDPARWGELTNWWHNKMRNIGAEPGEVKTLSVKEYEERFG